MPLQWKHRVLTTGLPRKSLYDFFGEMSVQIFSPFFLTGFLFYFIFFGAKLYMLFIYFGY